ncbi:hypothetical protein A2U01_0011858, partial [Trifolium medium]|nr:hypothetical protein [Trifolium medium]
EGWRRWHQRIGSAFGKYTPRRRQNIYFGGFVKGAFQHALDSKKARMQQYHTAHDVIKSICHDMDMDTAGLFAVLLWVLWNNRNDKVWNGSMEAGRSLGLKARQLWCEWYSVQTQQQQRPGAEQQQQQILTWQKPPMGWYKCNVDAGEALALLEAMKEVKHRGITHAIFETDSKNVVDAIHNLRGVYKATSEYGCSHAC